MNDPVTQEEAATAAMGPQQIVIADRGWVWVGRARIDGESVIIQNARCVRYWGTTRGLGQLAEEGPQPNTKLDPCGRVELNRRALIALIACRSEW